jgi:hypothetical protein
MWFNPVYLRFPPVVRMMVFNLETALVCASAVLLLSLPGAAILALFRDRRREAAEWLSISFGLGLSVVALGALLGRVAGFRFGPGLLAGSAAGFALLLALGLARKKIFVRFRLTAFAALELAAVAALVGLRFYQARDLALPAWVDSVHHVFLVRLFLEGGGIPATLSPWISGPFYYHFGFHAAAAVFSAVSGLTPDRAVLLFGQILNAAAALSAYRLSMALRRDRRTALLVLALVGFVAEMPAYYLTWGRYTLLAGMVLLPLAMAEAVEYTLRSPRPGSAVRLAILTAGTLLTHYLAGILLALFLALLGGYVLLRRNRRRRFPGLAVAVAGGTAAALPWLIPMLRYSAGSIGVDVVGPGGTADAAALAGLAEYLWKLLGPLPSYLLLGAGLIAALTALFRRGPIRIFAVWGLVMGVETLPWGLRIAPFRPDHLAIVLFLPASMLAADGFVRLADFLDRRIPALRAGFFFGGIALAGCLVGFWQTRTIVNPATVFADSDDRQAVLWAAQNTPANSVFLINVVPWQSGLFRGVDGGWWLEGLAERKTLLPPMLYSFAPRETVDRVDRLAATVSALTGCTQEFWSLVKAEGVTYLYIKDGAGSLQPGGLEGCSGIEAVFRIGKVRIYRVVARD